MQSAVVLRHQGGVVLAPRSAGAVVLYGSFLQNTRKGGRDPDPRRVQPGARPTERGPRCAGSMLFTVCGAAGAGRHNRPVRPGINRRRRSNASDPLRRGEAGRDQGGQRGGPRPLKRGEAGDFNTRMGADPRPPEGAAGSVTPRRGAPALERGAADGRSEGPGGPIPQTRMDRTAPAGSHPPRGRGKETPTTRTAHSPRLHRKLALLHCA